jgi:hypothetical protein
MSLTLLPWLAGLFGFAATLYLFYPGFMIWDSTWQLEQVITGDVVNAHPPVMVYLWGLAHRIHAGPGGMLALQSAGYWLGLGLCVGAVVRSPAWRVALLLALGFFPPVFGIVASVLKDSGALAALLMGFGLLLQARRRGRWLAAAAVPFSFYALAVRFNNVLTVFPLLWLLSDALLPARSRVRRAGAFAGLLVAMLAGTFALNTLGVERRAYYAAVPLWDLAWISIRTQQLLVPSVAITNPDLDLARLEKIVRPFRCDYMRVYDIYTGEASQDIEYTQLSGEEANEIIAAWLGGMVRHPFAYASHRLRVAQRLFFEPDPVFVHLMQNKASYPLPFRFSERPGYREWKRVFEASAKSILCRPWIYTVIAGLVWALSWRGRSDGARFARAVAASGLLSVLPLLALAPSADFRYAVWLVAAAPLSALLLASGSPSPRAGG